MMILSPSEGALEFLQMLVEDVGLEHKRLELDPGRPILIATLPGSEPALPSVLLNSHTDVVPVELSGWIHDPFEAHKDPQGRIYGRGAQDMKCVRHRHWLLSFTNYLS